MKTTYLKDTPVVTFTKPETDTKKARIAVLISEKSKGYASPEDQRMSDHYRYDDALLTEAFNKHNLIYEEVLWNDENVNWTDYDAILIRSTWDYHEGKLNQFLNTLKKIEDMGIPLFNSYETIKWNSKKTYLKDLVISGVPVIETMYATKTEMPNLETELLAKGWTECILKPAISAGAHKTFRVSNAKEAQNIYAASYDKDEMVMIQPFAQEIINEGEWSFVFLNGEYSHVVLKKPPYGDFRVQLFFGNQQEPESWMIESAKDIFKSVKNIIKETPLYIRIDTIKRAEKLYVMEIELIEPYLYLQTSDSAADKLVLPLKNKLESFKKLQLI